MALPTMPAAGYRHASLAGQCPPTRLAVGILPEPGQLWIGCLDWALDRQWLRAAGVIRIMETKTIKFRSNQFQRKTTFEQRKLYAGSHSHLGHVLQPTGAVL
jgi:hypothetical protein